MLLANEMETTDKRVGERSWWIRELIDKGPLLITGRLSESHHVVCFRSLHTMFQRVMAGKSITSTNAHQRGTRHSGAPYTQALIYAAIAMQSPSRRLNGCIDD